MSTAVTLPPNTQLPAHLAAAARHLVMNDAASGGIKAGGVPSIGIKGGKFFIKDPAAENPNMLITDSTPGREGLPLMALDVVIVAANQAVSKKFYKSKYDKDAEDKSPDCSSDNGLMPDAHIAAPVHPNCTDCNNNKWGSKINEENGKETKACGDSKRLVVIPLQDLAFKALALDVTAAALKEYGAFIRTLSGRNIPVVGIATRVTFDPEVSFPKLQFAFLRYLDEAEFHKVEARIDTEEVRNIASPKRVIPIAATAPAAPLKMPDATTHSVANAVAAAATALAGNTVPADPVTAATQAAAAVVTTPAPAAPAGGFSFGGAPAPAAETKRRTKKDTPAPGVDAVTAAAAAAVAQPGTVDIKTIPEPFKSTIIACGGLDTPGGKAVYDAMPKAAPAQPVVAAAPATGFAAPAAGVTVAPPGADLSTQLAALLSKK